MKIKEILKSKNRTLSFEVFPPKTDAGFDSVMESAGQIASLSPDFMSVTFGAGGGTSKHTVEIASRLQERHNVTALAHLTCVSSSEQEIDGTLARLQANGIENILALRGDLPENGSFPQKENFIYACQLVEKIKQAGHFCIGGACYPEGHVECAHKEEDILYLKQKVDAGCDFLTTQMFFDNNILYNFLYRIREKGITVPVIAGIMPVTNSNQIARICGLSGTYLPSRFKAIVDEFGDSPEAMKQAGIAYATEQIIDLFANGVHNIHVYSMNKPDVAFKIKENLSVIIGA